MTQKARTEQNKMKTPKQEKNEILFHIDEGENEDKIFWKEGASSNEWKLELHMVKDRMKKKKKNVLIPGFSFYVAASRPESRRRAAAHGRCL